MKYIYAIIAAAVLVVGGVMIFGGDDSSKESTVNADVSEKANSVAKNSTQEACEINADVTSVYVDPYNSVTCLENIDLSKEMFNGLCNIHETLQGDDMTVDAKVSYSKVCPSAYYGVCKNSTPDGKSWKIYYYDKKDVVFDPNTGEPFCDDWEYGIKG